MLAFTVATILDNRNQSAYKVECLETWGSKLLVGTSENGLLVYDVKEKETPEDFQVTVSEVYKQFSRGKPINQINVIESHKIVVSLSDGNIMVNDLPSFAPRTIIAKAKGANLFALDTSKNTPLLCASVKKKLLVFSWDGQDFVEAKTLQIPEPAVTLVWHELLYVGFKKEYSVIDPRSGTSSAIFPTGKVGDALANFIPPDQILLLKESILTLPSSLNFVDAALDVSIFVGLDGKATRKYGLSWSEPPIAVGYKFPYVISMQPRTVEVRMISGHAKIQNIPIKAVKENPLKCLTDKGDVYVATSNQVWRLIPVPLQLQIDQLVRDKEFDEAIILCDSISGSEVSKAEKLKQIKNLYAYHLFTQGQYERAMELFSDLDVDPLQVIGLYPNLLPKTVRQKYNYPIEVPDLVGAALEKAYQALLGYLAKKRTPYVAQLANAQSANTPAISLHSQDNVEYMNCTDVPTIIDTSLLKAYIKTNEALLAPLLRSPNFCHVKECQRVLNDYKKFHEQVLLFKHKRLHKEALELLQKLGNSNPANAPLGGPQETINYLRSLGKAHMSLICDFSKWVLNVAPQEEALSIFTEERSPQDRLPADQVVAHLKSYKPILLVQYLEHIIGDVASNNKNLEKGAEFHNELIFQYLEGIKALMSNPIYQETKRDGITAGSETGLLGSMRRKLLKFLEESQCYQPEKMFNRFPTEDLFEERAVLLSRIGQHEAALNIYAHKLKRFAMAEDYCAKHYNSEKEDARDVYLSLLRVYLRPPEATPPIPPMVQPAMNLLNKHYQRIDTPKALDLLPSNIPVKELYPFFESVLRDMTKNRRNNQVIKNLLKSENLQIREQLIKDRSHVIKITDERTCPVCTKRLGTSVFPCYVNGVVVHYMCLTNLQNQKKNAALPPPK